MFVSDFFPLLQSERFSRNASLLDPGLVQQTAAMLANATSHTEKFYGSDVKVAYRLALSLLQHESNQQGFNLTATQDVHFTEVQQRHDEYSHTLSENPLFMSRLLEAHHTLVPLPLRHPVNLKSFFV